MTFSPFKLDSSVTQFMAGVTAAIVMGVYAFVCIAPYLHLISPENAQTVQQNRDTINLITVMVVSYFFGKSSSEPTSNDK